MIGDKHDALTLADALCEVRRLDAEQRLLREARERDNVSFKQLLAQRDALLEALRWIASVNATDREYQAKARAAIALADALRESHPYPMHVRLAADELVWLFEARERDKVAFKQLLAQRDALLEALRLARLMLIAHGERHAKIDAAIRAVEGEKS